MRARIIFSHGNSFPAGTYKVLFESLRQRGFEVDAVEKFGHDPAYPVTNNWPHLVQQLADFARAKQGDGDAARPFYGELVEFMSRGPIVAAILEKDNAVEDFRTLIGATNPAEAAEGTIRKAYATSIGENAVHGSDSDENAAIEGAFHFAGREQF